MTGKTCTARPVIFPEPERGDRAMGVTVFGIRHHGPGCARSLRRALDELRPDVDRDGRPARCRGAPVVGRARGHEAAGGAPRLSGRRAAPRGLLSAGGLLSRMANARLGRREPVPVRFMDLPQSHQLAIEKAEEDGAVEDGRRSKRSAE